jgi:hypothetical protein
VAIESSSPFPGQPRIFSTADILGNAVDFYVDTWSIHILSAHPEMAPYQSFIEPCIIDPRAIRESTDSALALVFESTIDEFPPEDLLRVIVKYTDNRFMSGKSVGVVASAFPADSKKFSRSQVGPFVYKKTSKILKGK